MDETLTLFGPASVLHNRVAQARRNKANTLQAAAQSCLSVMKHAIFHPKISQHTVTFYVEEKKATLLRACEYHAL